LWILQQHRLIERDRIMDRSKIVAIISRRAGISKKDANSLFTEIVSLIEREIRKDGQLKLPGAGSVTLTAPKKKPVSKESKRKAGAVAKPKASAKKAAKKAAPKAAAKKAAPKGAPKKAAPKPAPAPEVEPGPSPSWMDKGVHGSGGGPDE
jgi:nucleoid DNA-binding protein